MPETKKLFAMFSVILGLAVLFLPQTALYAPGAVAGSFVEGPGKTLPVVPDLHPVSARPQNSVALLSVAAHSVLVKDRTTAEILYKKNENEIVPIASLTKLMTAIVVYEHTPLSAVVSVTADDVNTVPYRVGLVEGEKISVSALLQAMLVSSANDAALALARYSGGSVAAFVAQMNAEANRLGMTHTAFANPVGFDNPGQYSTASDLANLVEAFLNFPDLSKIVSIKTAVISSVDKRYTHRLLTTNQLMLQDSRIVGLKTGFTAEARGNLIILAEAWEKVSGSPHEYYSIVLGSGDRELDTKKIMNWVKDNFAWD